jgi:DNA-binding transcriptional LysR family regulator
VRVAGRFTVNSARAACELAVAGAGVVLAPNFVADPHLAAGRLVTLLPEWTSGVRGIHAVYPHRRHVALRLRMLIDFLAGRFASAPGQARASSASSPG